MGNNIIEINGKRYDAQSGTLLGKGTSGSTPKQALSHRGRIIDGFVKPGAAITTHQPPAAISEPVPTPKSAPLRKQAVKRTTVKHIDIGHKPQKAKTLMRHVVAKPTITKKPVIKAQAPSEVAAAPVAHLVPSNKVAAHNVNSRRLQRARTYDQHQNIKRFTTLQQNYPVKRQAQATQSGEQHKERHGAVLQATTQPAPHTAAPSGQKAVRHPAHNTGNKTQPPQSIHHKKRSADLFEAAVANARSHEQPAHKPRRSTRKKVLNVAAGLAAFVALAGFIAYTNMTNIEVRIASMRAGFTAELPDYNPTGYALDGGIKAQQGLVTATYRSGSNVYTLQQQVSDWDSQTLADTIDSQASEKTQILEGKGRTIYVYGKKAAWVNGGVLYSINTAGDISHDELLAIATSM